MNADQLLEVGIKKRNGQLTESWQQLAEKHSGGLFNDGESFRCWVKNKIKSNNVNNNEQDNIKFKEEHEIHKDGSQSSSKLVKMSLDQKKDPTYLLKAHGFDSDSWTLVSARNNIWNAYSKQDGIMQLYSSKITVKPKEYGFSMDQLLEEIKKLPPLYVKRETYNIEEKRLLEIPLFDSHFGVSDFEYYEQTQSETMSLIESKKWEEILFIFGQDAFHNDNFRGQTSSGTIIEKVDIVKAWSDAKKFYYPLLEKALLQSNRVILIYSKGNHDESFGWSFVQMIKERYPQIEVNDDFTERKIHTFGKVFIGITHGDKAKKNLHNLFPVEFPIEWANAKIREVHTGHFHLEDAKDWFGMMVRTLATRNKTDSWHKDNGFVGAHKRFMLFEYTQDELKSIHYV